MLGVGDKVQLGAFLLVDPGGVGGGGRREGGKGGGEVVLALLLLVPGEAPA